MWMKEASNHLQELENVANELHVFATLKERYQEKDKELANEQQQLDDVTYQKDEWLRLFEEDKEQKLNEIHQWLGQLAWLDVEEDVVQKSSRALRSLYEPDTYQAVIDPIRQVIFSYQQEQGQLLSEHKIDEKQLVEQIKEKEQELEEWKKKKDPEPPLESLSKEARQQLKQENIPFVPFYAAVEFQEHVTTDVRKRLEAALLDSGGVLDALITDRSETVKHDRILKPNPNMMAIH